MEWGVVGLWYGYSIGQGIVFFMYLLTYFATDWKLVFELVTEQMR